MLIAYPKGESQKSAVVAEMQGHAEADRLVQNYGYWEDGKGCAVGCLIKSGDHAEYEPRFGIPQALAKLEDTIFENLPRKEAMAWPVRFLSAPKVGADLSLVQWQFLEFVVGEALSRTGTESVRDACQPALDVVAAAARGEVIDASAEWSAAERSAWTSYSEQLIELMAAAPVTPQEVSA